MTPRSRFNSHLVADERSAPCPHDSSFMFQPFQHTGQLSPEDRLLVYATRTQGAWESLLNGEQTAFALGQVTAAAALPDLTEYVSVTGLLDGRLCLREVLADNVVEAMTAVMAENPQGSPWTQVDEHSYVSLLGWGVALCYEMTPGAEMLSLRFADDIAEAITQARRVVELPRSLVGMQTIIHERIDVLLASARARVYYQLCG